MEIARARLPEKTLKRVINGWIAQNGNAVTFIVSASRGETATTTVRLSVAVAVAKERPLADEGWQVIVSDIDRARDNLSYTTDFRRVYATMISNWLGLRDTRQLLNGSFEPFDLFRQTA